MIDVLSDPSHWILLVAVGLAAGFIDAIVGGGGMLTIPTLLSIGLPPHLTLGTNKLAGSFGSGMAAYTFFKKKLFTPYFWRQSFYSTLVGAITGTILVNFINTYWLEKLLPLVVLVVAVYTLIISTRSFAAIMFPAPRSCCPAACAFSMMILSPAFSYPSLAE